MAKEKLLEGLTNDCPKPNDASTVIKGGSVNSDPVRSGTAPSPGTLGPRTA